MPEFRNKIMHQFLAALCSFCLMLAAQAQVQTVTESPSTDAALEKHVLAVSEQLRCLVCQNQTIADSHADLAVDLRNQVREKIQQGMSDQAIFDFMVARYGDFVLYRPPLHNSTWLLWFGPFLLLFGGLFFLARKLRKRQPEQSAQQELSESDRQRSAQLLKNDSENSSPEKETP